MSWYGSVEGVLLMMAFLSEWCLAVIRVGETSPALLLATERTLPHHLLPLKFWANPRQSALKPRKRDLHEPTLLGLLGHDYDHRWMRTSTKPSQAVSTRFSFASFHYWIWGNRTWWEIFAPYLL
jgi:hypothetical protein